MGLDEGTKGALVSEVVTGGPADRAGLRGGTREETIEGVKIKVGGDVITGVNGQTVKDLYELVVYVERTQMPGNMVRLTIIRDKQTMELDLVLGVRPAP
jgi:2-alkenal reductase